MAVTIIHGKDASLYLDNTLVGCADEISIQMEAELDEATCKSSGGAKEFVAGATSWSGSLSGVYRIFTGTDVAANISAKNLFDKIKSGTKLALRFESDGATGDNVWAGDVLLTSWGLSAPNSGKSTFSADFQGTGELACTVVSGGA
jgi:hypothetical protein